MGMFDEVREFLSKLHSSDGLQRLLVDAGPWVLVLVGGIIFAETGLLIGFFLPGDSLLIMAGVVSALKGAINPWVGLPVITFAAVIGDQVGFLLGRAAGKAVFSRPDGRFIKRKHFVEAHAYYEKNGAKSIVVARFIPVLRTFVPFMAGVADMPYRSFVFWNAAGGCLWVWSLFGVGYALASNEVMVKRLHYIIVGVVLVSVLPIVIGVLKRWLAKRRA
jgi:membrane-associated protein